MLLLVVLLLLFSCYNAAASANNNKQQCGWLSISMGSTGGTAVKSVAVVTAPLGLAVLAVAIVRCLGSLLCCCLTVW